MAVELGYTKLTLGLMGGAFSLVYASGQLINGQLADSFGAKKLVFAGLILSAILNVLFGYSETPLLMTILWAINGYAQSTGWPSVVKVIRDWFHREALGTIGGLFGSCFLVGSMIALSTSGYITVDLGWRMAFLIPSIVVVLFAAIFYLGIIEESKRKRSLRLEEMDPKPKFRLRRILQTRRFILIAIAYTLLQFVRSGLTLWAPSFILESYSTSLDLASYSAAVISLGGIAGSIISGLLSDRIRASGREAIMAAMTLSLTLLLPILYSAISYGLSVGALLLFLSGLTLYGPHVIMVTTIPMDYGKRYGAAGIAGFIDGVGYIGTTFSDTFTGWIVDTASWGGAVTFWTASSLAATMLTFLLYRSNLHEAAKDGELP